MSVCGKGWKGRAREGRTARALARMDREHDTRTMDLEYHKVDGIILDGGNL